MKRFLSGDEAFAEGIRLACPDVISAYPITPQTVVVERLSEMVEDGSLDSEFIHVESEHSALSCAIGASAAGVRTFTATSSQGLLYMAEGLPYAAGGRFPVVMMNANRATALPWNIYGDQRDSLALLDTGWIQEYAADAQEALDMAVMSYYIAEHRDVSTPFMVNLDGFVLTHTYENVDIPDRERVREFLPPYETENCFDFEHPKNIGFSAGPETNFIFKYKEHRAFERAIHVIKEAERRFGELFGRKYTGLAEEYLTEDADYVIITLGTAAGLCRTIADELRREGVKAGVLRIRYMRPFPNEEIARALKNAKAAAVLEKDISFGNAGTVYVNVAAALQWAGVSTPLYDFVGGLGGKDITHADIRNIYESMGKGAPRVTFMGIGVE
ncbi:MAG: pyruvate ferredoxin oxidoreductase [Oscillospiraceae bacterium]|nr:pyruvate ferredoxin oxidoreductase [Oscillospiraceae bacterium]